MTQGTGRAALLGCLQGDDTACRTSIEDIRCMGRRAYGEEVLLPPDPQGCADFDRAACQRWRAVLAQEQMEIQEQRRQEDTQATGNLLEALIVGVLSSLTYPKYAGPAYGVQQGINAGLSTWTGQPVPEPLYPPLPQPPAPVQCRWVGQYWTCW